MTPRSPTGSRARSARKRRPGAPSAASSPARMRYGENPHQSAAFYIGPDSRAGVATARQVQGKALSYNNVNDTDAAYELVAEFDPARTAAVAIIKHANPCGVAEGATLLRGLRKGARLRSGFGFRRRRRAQPAARRGGGAQDRRDIHRGHHRARGRRGGFGDRRGKKKSAPAHRRRACPTRARRASRYARSPAACSCRIATTPSSTIFDLESRDASARRASASSPTCALPGGSPSMSSRTPSSMRRTARRSASAPDRCRASIPRSRGAQGRGRGARPRERRRRRRKARSSPPTLSFPSPTDCSRRRRRARPRSSSPAARCATMKSSPPPTRRASRWSSPACAISGIERPASSPGRAAGSIGMAPRRRVKNSRSDAFGPARPHPHRGRSLALRCFERMQW